MTCSIEGCDRVRKSRGWCEMHYYRWRRKGDPEAVPFDDPVVRFWKKVKRSGDCLVWVGTAVKGYGRFGGVMAHRWAYERFIGSIPEGMEIDHLCFTPLCVNPRHLEAVTPTENIRRATAAGRYKKKRAS